MSVIERRDYLREEHSGWWQDGFTAGADPESEVHVLPLVAGHLSGARRVLDIGTGEGQVARLAAESGANVMGIDPTWAQVTEEVFIPFVHRPISRYVNAPTDIRVLLPRMEEPAPPPGLLAHAPDYSDAAEIPRLIFMRTEKR